MRIGSLMVALIVLATLASCYAAPEDTLGATAATTTGTTTTAGTTSSTSIASASGASGTTFTSSTSSTTGATTSISTTGSGTSAGTGGFTTGDTAVSSTGATTNGSFSTTSSTSGGSFGTMGSTSGFSSTTTGSTGGFSSTTTGGNGDLSCLGHEHTGTPTATSANLALVFKDGISGAKVSGATVNLCDATTVSTACDATNRVATGTTDANGSVTLAVPLSSGDAFFGFVELTGSTSALNTFVYLPPITQNLSENVATLSSTDIQLAGVFLTGETLDLTTHGLVDGAVIDCVFNSFAGATVATNSADASTRVNYFAGGFPTATATATDASGNFLVVNAPVTNALKVIYFSDASQTTAVASYVVQVAANSVTTILGPPNQ